MGCESSVQFKTSDVRPTKNPYEYDVYADELNLYLYHPCNSSGYRYVDIEVENGSFDQSDFSDFDDFEEIEPRSRSEKQMKSPRYENSQFMDNTSNLSTNMNPFRDNIATNILKCDFDDSCAPNLNNEAESLANPYRKNVINGNQYQSEGQDTSSDEEDFTTTMTTETKAIQDTSYGLTTQTKTDDFSEEIVRF